MGSAGDIFLRSIIATFEALPRDYKSNDGFKYGKRIVFSNAYSTDRGFWSFYSHYYAGERLHDLDRIFHVLDDQQPPTWAQGAVQAVCDAVRLRKPFDIETAYFRIKGYANGNLHVWPRDPALTRKANELLAAHYGWAVGDGRKTG